MYKLYHKRVIPKARGWWLTHGLVFGGDGGGVVQDQDVSLKLPAGHGVLTEGQHHHPLPDLVTADL